MNSLPKSPFGFLRVAAASPTVHLGDIKKTAEEILMLANRIAEVDKARLIVFPELCLAGGYTTADLFHQEALLKEILQALELIICESHNYNTVLVVGLPMMIHSGLYNVAAIIDRGHLVGIVPKTYLPTGGEFYESRWFNSAHDLTVSTFEMHGCFRETPVGTDLLFVDSHDPSVILGVELCEDLWTAIPPSSYATLAGATVIANLSASNELVGKANYRRNLVAQQSGRAICGYVYSSAGVGESTTDVVFGGHRIIAENGAVIKEESLLLEDKDMRGSKTEYTLADLDISSCVHDRMRTTSFGKSAHELQNRQPYRRIKVQLQLEAPMESHPLYRPNPARPFVPDRGNESVCRDIFRIQSAGLTQRLKACGAEHVVLGLSGGLDSTLALLVCLEAFSDLGLRRENIHAYSMPCFGTTSGTRNNAEALAKLTKISFEEIPIGEGAEQVLRDIKHGGKEDVTFENAQARYRTLILMQKANQLGGIVIGTGDLSESAIGWCTYNGDHMSHYNVNCSIPKTLVRYVIDWATMHNMYGPDWYSVVKSILDTPVSPELTSATNDEVSQKTEDIVGPYDLHDFFIYHFVRKGAPPSKILYLASRAFTKKQHRFDGDPEHYPREVIKKWLIVFLKRFFMSQFKRSAVPDGPKVGSVSLSPRGDWRMPSDASAATWLAELERNS